MVIKATYNMNQIRQELKQFAEKIDEDIFATLQQVGETFVGDARNMSKAQGGFGDVTGNLRSSIGYFIRRTGKVVFSEIKGDSVGASVAEIALNEVPPSSGFQLVGLAGMDYASHVESRGLNVITVQGEMMLVNLDSYLKKLEKKYNKK